MARYSSTIHLDLDDEPYKLVEIHPVVLFSILENYIRREDGIDRVIGTLLGFFGSDGIVQITNCYTVPHNEKPDQFALNVDFHKRMLTLHGTVAPHQQVVGWYSTAYNSASVLVHNFYAKEMNRAPVHLLIDPASLEKGLLSVNGFYSLTVHLEINLNQCRDLEKIQKIKNYRSILDLYVQQLKVVMENVLFWNGSLKTRKWHYHPNSPII